MADDLLSRIYCKIEEAIIKEELYTGDLVEIEMELEDNEKFYFLNNVYNKLNSDTDCIYEFKDGKLFLIYRIGE